MPATLPRRPSLSFWSHALLTAGLLLAACSSNDTKGTGKTADTSLQFDSNLNPQDSKDPDTGTPSLDGVGTGDVSANCPGGAGCPCAENSDCETGLCIDDPSLTEGRACAHPCGSQCPAGYLCRPLTGPAGDISNFCVPHYGHLCDPCATSKDCQALGLTDAVCTNQGKLGQFCGVACQGAGDCPKGYTCDSVPSVEGPASKQCVRAPDQPGGPYGVCECSKSAVAKGLHTTCAVEVKGAEGQVLGTCQGTRTCTAAGLGDCNAPPAQAETCNGLDDNCNGQTDEGSCDDKNGCTQDSCDGKGGCKHVALDGTSCDADGSACTPDDTCKQGTCIAGAPLACNDKNPCTKDSCDLALGFTHTEANGVPCEDDNPCTIGDLCTGGQCQPGPAKLCSAPDGCQTASCDLQSGNCKYGIAPDTTPCDDGLLCTTADGCSGGTCKGTPKQCDDGNPCTQDLCEPKSGCTAASQGAIACDDGNACTSGDACQGGSCVGKASTCDDENPCTADTCDVKLGCAHTETSDACDDGNPCSKGDACAGGKCVPGASVCACQSDADCPDDGNLCNGLPVCDKSGGTAKCAIAPLSLVLCSSSLDTACSKSQCEPATGKCALKALGDGSLCEDGSACTAGDVCTGGICKSGQGLNCDDGNPCTADSCDAAAGCVHAAQNGVACDADGSACTQGDACNGGVCGKGPALVCDDGNPCTTDSCDPAQGCLFAPNAAVCSDGNPCTQGDVCSKGACVPGASVCACQKDADCPDDGNLCNGTEFCDTSAAPYVCKLKPGSAVTCDVSKDGPCSTTECAVKTGLCGPVAKQDGASCSDGSACTAGDACAGGSCVAGAKVACDDGNPCTADSCDAGKGCVFAANSAPCNDGDSCTANDVCAGGKCSAGVATDCNDKNSCTTDTCDVAAGCKHTAVAGPCDDGSACTLTDTCSSGVCVGTAGNLFVVTILGPEHTGWAALTAVPNGHIVLGGTTAVPGSPNGGAPQKARIVEVSQIGSLMYDQQLAPGAIAGASSVVAVGDTGVGVAGYALQSETSPSDCWVARLDAKGNQLWSGLFGSSDEYCSRAALAQDGGFIAVGWNNLPNGAMRAYAIRVSSTGVKVWESDYWKNNSEEAKAVVALADGGFLIAANQGGAGGTPWLVRVDSAGKNLWDKTYAGVGDVPFDVIDLGAAGLAMSVRGGWVVRLDAGGNMLWSKNFAAKQPSFQYFAGLARAGDGGFVLAGDTTVGGFGGYDFLAAHLDANGNLVWQRAYGGKGSEMVTSVVALPDGGHALAGVMDTAKNAFVVARTDAWGYASCSDAGKCSGVPLAACDDKNACTADVCTSTTGACAHTQLSDGASCGSVSVCKTGVCNQP
ncbi:MAG: PQQ-like beta-propeller repeat protein [Deltaproteobacteria bacterium]|nr:PQQ-like beta-propeller repeat protein [Deltaproteobacteria bacterium]